MCGRFNVVAAATLPHRGALHSWFRFATEEQPEHGSECWSVATPEISTPRQDNGKLDIDVGRIQEHVSPLRAVNTSPDRFLANIVSETSKVRVGQRADGLKWIRPLTCSAETSREMKPFSKPVGGSTASLDDR